MRYVSPTKESPAAKPKPKARKSLITAGVLTAALTLGGTIYGKYEAKADEPQKEEAPSPARLDERLKATDERVTKIEKHVEEHDKLIHSIDTRTRVMRAEGNARDTVIMDALRVPTSRRPKIEPEVDP